MGRVGIQDTSIRDLASASDSAVLFKEKIEIAKLLDRLGADVIGLPLWTGSKADLLLIKAVAMDVRNASVSVAIGLDAPGLERLQDAIGLAVRPRLAVRCMVSSVGMEYLQGKKEPQVLQSVAKTVSECSKLVSDVEFVILDASRADGQFLAKVADEAIRSGANIITLCDTAGLVFPHEIESRRNLFVSSLTAFDPGKVKLGVRFSDSLKMGAALTYYALKSGFDEISVSFAGSDAPSLSNVAGVLSAQQTDASGLFGIDVSNIRNVSAKIRRICDGADVSDKVVRCGSADEDDSIFLTASDSKQTVGELAHKLGYDLSEQDLAAVYEAFARNVRKKKRLGRKEFESILATEAMQVPATYVLKDYVYTSGASSRSMSHITLEKDGRTFEGIAVGDGPIDASFLAIGKIAGQKYELDDFVIRSITEGQESMGETLVKLRFNGKLYSGCGISTDIVASSIRAYLIALNKIIWEEEGSDRK